MKKSFVIFILSIALLLITGCTEKEYDGQDIKSIEFSTTDYNGGLTVDHLIDLETNEYKQRRYNPFASLLIDYETIREFTEEEEKVFINGIYNAGLLNIDEEYSEEGVIDGGGWHLIIKYNDDSIFESNGSNASPTDVFNKCSVFFYDLCKKEIMGVLPEYYIYPPEVSFSIEYEDENGNTALDNSFTKFTRVNYKWNNVVKELGSYYGINNLFKIHNTFKDDINYKLVLYTSNYHYKEKFNNCEVREYNFDSDLTGEEIIYKGHWFEQIEVELKLDKIYVFRYSYKDGDYVEYTFSTYVNGERYKLNIHDNYNLLTSQLKEYYKPGEVINFSLGFRSGPKTGVYVDGKELEIIKDTGSTHYSFIMPDHNVSLFTYYNEFNEKDCGDYNHTWIKDDREWYKHKCEICGKLTNEDKPDKKFFSLNEAYLNGYINDDNVRNIVDNYNSHIFNPVEIDSEIEGIIVNEFCKENNIDVNIYPGSIRCFGVFGDYYAVMVDGCGLMYLQWITYDIVGGVKIQYGSSQHIYIWKK